MQRYTYVLTTAGAPERYANRTSDVEPWMTAHRQLGWFFRDPSLNEACRTRTCCGAPARTGTGAHTCSCETRSKALRSASLVFSGRGAQIGSSKPGSATSRK